MSNADRIKHATIVAFEALVACEYITADRNDETPCLAVVGSTYIQDKEDSDVDLLFLRPADPTELSFDGWVYGGSTPMCGDNWCSWKKTSDGVEVNLIVCSSQDYIDAWLASADVCRFLHLKGVPLNRGIVHGVHEIIMDGSDVETQLSVRNYT